jgi:hypothetical protein
VFCDPLLPIAIALFFPDGDHFFERVDQPTTGLEGFRSVSRRNGHRHGRFSDLQASDPMDHRNALGAMIAESCLGEFGEGRLRHPAIGLIIELRDLSLSRMIPNPPHEQHDSALTVPFDCTQHGVQVDGVLGHMDHLSLLTQAE